MLTAGSQKRVLITGVNGFLGGALWRYFKKKGKPYEVFGLDRKGGGASPRSIKCDLGSLRETKKVLQKLRPHYILHFAGGVTDGLKVYTGLTENLFRAVGAIEGYSPRIVVPGSAAEYGIMPKRRRRLREDDALKPVTPYGRAKKRQIRLALNFARRGSDVIVPRIFNVMGEGMPAHLALGNFARQIAAIEKGRQRPVITTGPLLAGRDFLDVEDVCAAIHGLMKRGRPGQVYNICSGRKTVMENLLDGLIRLSTSDNITVTEQRSSRARLYDVIGSNAKFRSLTGWRPKIGLRTSLKKTLDVYRAN